MDLGLLEHCVRDELNDSAQRRIAVIDPVKVVIDNYPADKVEYFTASNNPNDEAAGTRELPFTKELYIERADFRTEKAPKFFRLFPDNEVRLMNAYIIKCTGYETDENGNVTEIHANADLETGCSMPADGRKVKGTIHWLSASECENAEIIHYDRLFTEENMTALPEGKTYGDFLNPDSVVRYPDAKVEKALAAAESGDKFQFVRNGYFCRDSKNTDRLVFNSIVELRDSKGK